MSNNHARTLIIAIIATITLLLSIQLVETTTTTTTTHFPIDVSHGGNANSNNKNYGTIPKSFERILIVNFENQPILKTLQRPYFYELATKVGTLLNSYYAITHPSQPNYLTQIAGDYFGWNSDKDINLNKTNLVDLLEEKKLTWKAYQENYPKEYSGSSKCFTPSNYDKLYYRKHNPFISFDNIRLNPNRCQKIVNEIQFEKDISLNNLPNVMYYTPNIDNDAHNTGLDFADQWLKKWLPPKLENVKFMNNTLIVLTFDEDDGNFENHIYTVLIGNMVVKGGVDNTRYNHYSLLKTIEDNFELGNLGRNDVGATSFTCLKKN
ncbi:hypothetical protein ABK040_010765 [Willaertia magna]